MAIREIVKEGDPRLRKICRPVDEVTDRIKELLDDMRETMHAANGVGLAAPQVGILRRICIVEVEDELFELINPEIISAKGEDEDAEGCLSCPGLAGLVVRPTKLEVRAMDRNGKMQTYKVKDFTARAFCHEIDHLDGILYIDKVTRMLEPGDLEGDED